MEVFKDAKVCFTHFVKMMDDTSTTTENMCMAFICRMAAVCYSRQRLVDIMVPVLLQMGPIGEKQMTMLMTQVKWQQKKGCEGNTDDEAITRDIPKD